jgi:hypothetical protein
MRSRCERNTALRIAVVARQRDILAQFLAEASTGLSLLRGLFRAKLGLAAAYKYHCSSAAADAHAIS